VAEPVLAVTPFVFVMLLGVTGSGSIIVVSGSEFGRGLAKELFSRASPHPARAIAPQAR
jgi:hypothetical protein